jgi:hypothetical protein
MKARFSEPFAGGRLASSGGRRKSEDWSGARRWGRGTPQPFPSMSFLDTPGALREGLRCFTAFRLLSSRDFVSLEKAETLDLSF